MEGGEVPPSKPLWEEIDNKSWEYTKWSNATPVCSQDMLSLALFHFTNTFEFVWCNSNYLVRFVFWKQPIGWWNGHRKHKLNFQRKVPFYVPPTNNLVLWTIRVYLKYQIIVSWRLWTSKKQVSVQNNYGNNKQFTSCESFSYSSTTCRSHLVFTAFWNE